MKLPFNLSSKSWRDGFWSLAGTVASIFAGLAIVKIAAVWIPGEQYGEASLVLGVVVLLNNLIIGPLMAAHMRVYFDYLQRGLARWFAWLFFKVTLIAASTCVGMYILIATGWWALGSPYLIKMAVPATLLIIIQPFMTITTNYLEANRLYFRLAMVNTGQKILQVPALLLLLAAPISAASALILSQAGAIAPLLASARGVLAKGVLGKGSAATPSGMKAVHEVLREFSTFGMALPLGYFVNWILSTSDRYILAHFMTTLDVGVYAMNYGFWSLPYLMLNAWLEILTRPRIYERASRKDWRGMRNIIVIRMCLALGLGLAGSALLILFGQTISFVILGSSYQTDWSVSASIAIAHLFLIVGYSASPVFLATKKMKTILYATIIAAILNVCLNVWAVPAFGLVGAAMSTMVAYFFWASIIVISAIRYTAKLCGTDSEESVDGNFSE